MKPKLISFLPGVGWFIITFVLLVIPGSDIPHSGFFTIPNLDKLVHIGMFGILTLLFCYPFLQSRTGSPRIFVIIALMAISYGAFMEFVQKAFTEERSFDFLDIAADAAGALLALLWVIFWRKRIKTESR